jgi:protein-L-isoaspartate(D-aspartate) O-methyltransferase
MSKRLILIAGGLLILALVILLLVQLVGPRGAVPSAALTPGTPPPAAAALTPTPSSDGVFAAVRATMVDAQIEARGVKDAAVLDAMRAVPRHEFVLPEYLYAAYEDHPLPIGHGQTISQPYIVALMTEALQVQPGDRVLEIGTGSGYQAAVLAALDVEVYTVEIVPALAEQAAERLARLGYEDVQVRQADGYFGWEEHAPFDAIIVTAAPDHLPQPLTGQLAEGGRLVVPVGPQGAVQTLWLFEQREGELQATNLGAVSFVPLTGEGH